MQVKVVYLMQIKVAHFQMFFDIKQLSKFLKLLRKKLLTDGKSTLITQTLIVVFFKIVCK